MSKTNEVKKPINQPPKTPNNTENYLNRSSVSLRLRGKVLLLSLLLLFMTCPKPEKNQPVELTLYETYCTEIELKITMDDSTTMKDYRIERNDSTVISGVLQENEKIITDTNLEPNTEYTYKAYSKNDESEVLSVTTMDTTSHDFSWTIDTLGTYGSILRDVAIIDENDIWVVGEIRTDSVNYNAGHWDGEEWELVKIFSGNTEVNSIKYFNDNNIWVTTGGFPSYWNGDEWKLYHLDNMGMNVGILKSIWGTSSDNIYFVGNNGSIVHYDGSEFTKLDIGMDIEGHFVDIDGTANGEKVFVVIYQHWHAPHKGVVFQIENKNVSTLFYSDDNTNDYGFYNTPIAVNVIDNYAYIKVYQNIWIHNTDGSRDKFISINNYNCNEMTKLFGKNHNDLYGVGDDGWFMHYNGIEWRCINWESEYGAFYNGDNYGNSVIIVGKTNYRQGLIVRGKRN